MAKAEVEQWIELGKQAKKTQREIFKLLEVSNRTKIPKTISNEIGKCVNAMQEFKMKSEDRMFYEHPNLDDEALNIFYGKYNDNE